MRNVLSGGESGGGSVAVVIAVVVVLWSRILLFSIIVLCWPYVKCETDSGNYQ